jgi:carboxylesterase
LSLFTVLTAGLGALVLVHAVVYIARMQQTRREDATRRPRDADGIVTGARSIELRGSDTHAALLLHGFGDTPQTLYGLAHALHVSGGWTVLAPLLPGHGRALSAFDRTSSDEWRAMVKREYEALRASHATVVLVGLSMGGALATIQAALDPDLPALVLLAPYLTPPARAERLAPLAGVIRCFTAYMRGGDRVASIFDPAARELSLGYIAAPPTRIRDLVTVAHDARFAAADVRAPTLLIHSRTDYRIPLPQAEQHRAFFTAATPCEQQWLDGCGHVITVDFCREQVWSSTAAWLERFAGAPRGSRQPPNLLQPLE